MNKKFKTSIFGVFLLTMVLFLMACDTNTNPSDHIDTPLSYTLMFDTDGGSNIDTATFKVGDKIELELTPPTKDGYIFIGWEPSMPTIMPAHHVTLKATWEPNSYTITFDTDGGSSIDPLTLPYLEGLPEIEVPTKEGYIFGGWDITLPDMMPLNGLNVKAIWTKESYTVTFDTGGGSKIDPIVLAYEENIYAPLEPTKPGYIFIGWDKELPDTMPAHDVYLKAVWERIILDSNDTLRENFESLQAIKDSGQNSSEYMDYDYIGETYVLWELVNARIDLGMTKGGNAITIGGFGNIYTDAGMGRIYAAQIHDGIQSISFDARLPFSPKSTYPQVNGKDKAINVVIKLFINGELIESFKFKDDDEANKGTTFSIDNLNITGTYSLSIEVSSGHRLTLDNILWITNKSGDISETEPVLIDFESASNAFDYTEQVRNIGGIDFMMKEVHTLNMHGDKELAYMDSEVHGNVVARFRGLSTHYMSTESAYMYNVEAFIHVDTLSFDARLFGSNGYFTFESVINIYYMNDETSTFELLDTVSGLTEDFMYYEILIDKSNVQIKIEVLNGTVNIDNIKFD
ncbi:InlB B-repeat-containing protein [Acholeplasma laidlawii]|uniref:InlB B-repeat-containing protein n=1 Tax=Acholeplasma laidlawii TaxID=2148 RepID=UPI003F8E9105